MLRQIIGNLTLLATDNKIEVCLYGCKGGLEFMRDRSNELRLHFVERAKLLIDPFQFSLRFFDIFENIERRHPRIVELLYTFFQFFGSLLHFFFQGLAVFL